MRTKIKSKKVRMVPETDVPYENWIQAWGVSNQNKRKDTKECKEVVKDKLKGWLP